MRKPAFCICKKKNKGADQLRGNHTADRRLCFPYIDSTIPLFRPLEIFCDCTAQFVSNLVRNPKDSFCRDEAQIIKYPESTEFLGKNHQSKSLPLLISCSVEFVSMKSFITWDSVFDIHLKRLSYWLVIDTYVPSQKHE